jgi:DNA-binding CsgD family transcriptional regulator
MISKKHTRKWERLKLWTCAGFEIPVIAPDVLKLLTEIIPADAALLYLDAADPQMPPFFYHTDSPDAVKALFANEPQLFRGEHDYNVGHVMHAVGWLKAGNFLTMPRPYFASNTYQLLVRASGHHHALDVRLEVAGKAVGALMLFRAPGLEFNAEDVDNITRAARYLEHGLSHPVHAHHEIVTQQDAMIVASEEGRLLHLSSQATQLLQQLSLMGNAITDAQQLPPVMQALIRQLRVSPTQSLSLPEHKIAVPGGYLTIRAYWLNATDTQTTQRWVGFTINKIYPKHVILMSALCDATLTPREVNITRLLIQHYASAEIRAQLGMSEAVYRDSIRTIYRKLDINNQRDLYGRVDALVQDASRS